MFRIAFLSSVMNFYGNRLLLKCNKISLFIFQNYGEMIKGRRKKETSRPV